MRNRSFVSITIFKWGRRSVDSSAVILLVVEQNRSERLLKVLLENYN